VDVTSGEPVVASLQGHTMVPDDTGDVDLAVQVLVAFVLIQTVLERLADGDPMVKGSWCFKVAVIYTIMAHMF
jgi:hypothetical protein